MLFRLTGPVLLILLMAQPGLTALAQPGYPKAVDPYVDDFARLLTAKETTELRTTLSNFKNRTGITLMVVTIPSFRRYRTGDETLEAFATNLFNTRRIGNSVKNDGVLILVAAKDRRVRIELGSGYGSGQDPRMQGVITEHLLPHFKRQRYGQGILEGTDAVIRQLSEIGSVAAPTPPVLSPLTKAQIAETVSKSDDDSLLYSMLGLAILFGAAGFGAFWYFWLRHQYCRTCQNRMVRLDSVAENRFLDQGQILEKSLGSVEYHVWHCATCDQHSVRKDQRSFSRFSYCGSCGYRTSEVSEVNTVPPTHISEGYKETRLICRHCSYTTQEIQTLPMLVSSTHYSHTHNHFGSYDSSSSSSSSFDSSSSSSSYDSGSSSSSSNDSSSSSSSSYDSGGSSSGGGASGDW